MVATSIIAVVILSLILFVYKFIWPKRNINYLTLIILISIPPIISIFRPGSYESGDLTLHTVRFISFYRSLLEGNIIPQWSGDLNAGFGEPLFIFAQTLPYHIAAFFHFIGFSFLDSIKILLALSFITSGITMYLFAKEQFGKLPGFFAAILYQFAPYHFVDLHFRANPGETLAFVFPPLLMLAIYKIFYSKNINFWIIVGAFTTALLILAHPIAIITFPFIVLYSLYHSYKTRKLKLLALSFLSFILGLLMSSYYWLPEILLSKYTHQAYYHSETTFEEITELIYSPWRYGLLFQGSYGELSFALGYVQIFILLLGIFFFFKNKFKKDEKILFLFLFTCFLAAAFFILEYSKFLWEILPIIKNLQFSYRINVLNVLILAAIGGLVAKKIQKNILLIIIIIAIGITILNWGNRRTIPEITDAYIIKQLPQSSYLYEGSAPSAPKWTDPENVWVKDIPPSYLEVINGKADVKQISRSSTEHRYIVNVYKKTLFKENTLYFPGWTVYVGGRKHAIDYQNKEYPGLIIFSLSPGFYEIVVKYQLTTIQLISHSLSLLIFTSLIGYILFYRKLN